MWVSLPLRRGMVPLAGVGLVFRGGLHMYQALVGYVSNNQCDEIVNYYRCLEVLTSHIVGPTIFVMIEHTREISIYVLIEYKPSQHSRLPPAAQHSDTSTATRLTTMRIPASSRLLHDPDVNTIFFYCHFMAYALFAPVAPSDFSTLVRTTHSHLDIHH